jgi:hypothetical protein
MSSKMLEIPGMPTVLSRLKTWLSSAASVVTKAHGLVTWAYTTHPFLTGVAVGAIGMLGIIAGVR